ncbi:MAG: hypothetical protein GY722_25480 [bacterium]|nr:hypothetical protein [bacterium]
MKRTVVVIVLSLLVAACGDDGLLDGLGDRSVQAVHGETSSTTSTTEVEREEAPIGSVRSSDLVWYNDGLPGASTSSETAVVISSVWRRGDGVTSVIQSSRNEIAVALPGILFPELSPDSVGWVTSQLVYDVASGTLDPSTAAQFGLWHLEPYSTDGGRTALLRVRAATSTDVIGPIASETTSTGLDLSWVAESYHYVISCPDDLAEASCWQMAESAVPLRFLLPELATS